MVDVGILGPEDRVELIEGEILTKMPQNSPHATGVQLGGDVLRECFGPGFVVRSQLPLAISGNSEPEPDIAVVSGSPRDFRDAHPSTALLIVEVADVSRLTYDRTTKKRMYARCGVPEYWILNLVDRTLEVHRHPGGDDFRHRQVYGIADEASPLARPQARVRVADLLP